MAAWGAIWPPLRSTDLTHVHEKYYSELYFGEKNIKKQKSLFPYVSFDMFLIPKPKEKNVRYS
jgi:hypothetical protein